MGNMAQIIVPGSTGVPWIGIEPPAHPRAGQDFILGLAVTTDFVALALPGGPPTIDENRLARDQGRCAGGKEYNHARHIHWFTNSMKRRNTLDHVRVELGIGQTALRPRGTE